MFLHTRGLYLKTGQELGNQWLPNMHEALGSIKKKKKKERKGQREEGTKQNKVHIQRSNLCPFRGYTPLRQ
jgi:hypothetical protein